MAGASGMVGTALTCWLKRYGYTNLLTPTHQELDLTNQYEVSQYFSVNKPEYIFLVAAKVGGIQVNIQLPAQFIYDNLMIQSNIIQTAYRYSIKKLLFLGSSCIYPRLAPQPMKEEYLLTGPLESTNESYALAKIAGIKMCKAYNQQYGTDYISLIPSNLYGPRDNFGQTGHVLASLIRKFYEAKVNMDACVILWGTGQTRREFLHVDDLVRAMIYIMNSDSNSLQEDVYNIGYGSDISISELADLVASTIGYHGKIIWDTSRVDGMPRKLLDSTKMRSLSWKPEIDLRSGICSVYNWYAKSSKEEKEIILL